MKTRVLRLGQLFSAELLSSCHDCAVNSIPQVMTDRAEFEFQLFGQPEFRLNGSELNLSVRKVLALLAYLTIEGSGSRSVLAGLLWTELDEASARRNLRQRLYRLSPPELAMCVLVEANRVSLASFVASDVARFDLAMLESRFEEAVGLYRGMFLDGLELEEASAFHEWLDVKRELFERAFQRALAGFADQLEVSGATREALKQHQRLIEVNPLLELHQRHVMRLCASLGERAEALAGFEHFRGLLELELGLLPTPETLSLAAQIREQGVLEQPLPDQTTIQRLPLATTPLIGRTTVLDQLELAWNAEKMIFVTGEPGVGKSRLLTEFVQHKTAQIIHGRAGDATIPFATLTRVIRKLLQANPNPVLPRWVRQELSRLVPSLDEAPAPGGAEARIRLFDAFAEFVWLTTSQIDTYIVDDLQFFDNDSFEMLLHAFSSADRPAGKHQVLAYRTGELSVLMTANLEQVFKAGHTVQIQLEPLNEAAVCNLIETLFGSQEPVLFARRLHRATGGNPFFALETLKSLVESNALQQNEQGDWGTSFDDTTTSYAELPMPESVVAAVRERVARLGIQATRLLETASLAGDAFTLEDLLFATTLTEFEALEGFERALELHLLERQATGYRFTHDLVRESLALGLGAERRRLLHRKLAENLEKRGGVAARIALHLEQASQRQAAVPWRMRAAEDARRVYAHRDALEHYRQALQDQANPLEAFAIHQSRIELLGWLGEYEELAVTLDQMDRLASAIGQTATLAQACLARANVAVQRSDYKSALEFIATFFKQPNPEARFAAQASRLNGQALAQLGHLDEADKHLRQALDWAAEIPTVRAAVHIELGSLALQRNDLTVAETQFESALKIATQTTDKLTEVNARSNLARIKALQGETEQAISAFEHALDLSRTYGLLRLEGTILLNLSATFANNGQHDHAMKYLEQSLALVHDPNREGLILQNMGGIHYSLGRFGFALEHFQRAFEAARKAGLVKNQLHRQVSIADLLIQLGDPSAAKLLLEDALKLMRTSGNVAVELWAQINLARIEWLAGHVHIALEQYGLLTAPLHSTEDYWLRWLKALAYISLGEPVKALEFVPDPLPTPHEMRFLSVRLQAQHLLGTTDQNLLNAAQAQLETKPASLIDALELRRSLGKAHELAGDTNRALTLHTHFKHDLLEMSATLEAYPDLQASFLEKYGEPI
jgi:DNA-binding SARP family transcriptional activator/predicted ATPase